MTHVAIPKTQSSGKDVSDSVVRTVLLPVVLTTATRIGLDVSGVADDTLVFVLSTAVGYVGYAVVRALEAFASPKWGYILGLPGAPTYVRPE